MIMGQSNRPPIDEMPMVEKQLWMAVITSTIREWATGPLRQKREAEHYLFVDEKDFPLVCASAGIDVGRLRSQLAKIRGREMSLFTAAAHA
jgi:hypothetical protein